MDGRAYVAKDSEPYTHYWLTERERLLHGLFAGRHGATPSDAIDRYFRLTRTPRHARTRARLLATIAEMQQAGVLANVRADASRYDAASVDAYLHHRPFPSEIADHLVARGCVQSFSRVLDLAGGPGSLALALAKHSDDVSLMDLSRAFLTAATRRALAAGHTLKTIHESCNRLQHLDEVYDVITISQALHWLDPAAVVRGVCRVLNAGGHFFVIHSSIEVDDQHPLAMVLGRHSIFCVKPAQTFAEEVAPILSQLTHLFQGLGSGPTSATALDGPIVPAGAAFFAQTRPFDLGYVRAFLTDTHITAIGRTPETFWREIEALAATADEDACVGVQHWAVLQFTRGGVPATDVLATASSTPIGFTRDALCTGSR